MKAEFVSMHVQPLVMARAADYFHLARPRLALLVLATVALGWFLAAGTTSQPLTLVHTLMATALLFAGVSAINQLLERDRDAMMARTANRPLPSGKLQPWEVLFLGCSFIVCGLIVLLAVRQPLAALLGALAVFCYLFVYTPLKSRTTLNTLLGAVPGAVPPLMGWAAARGRLDAGAYTLFLILFLWQVPHFLAIAWIYREQYARAGLFMLPVIDCNGKQTARQMLRFTLLLILASLLPFGLGQIRWISALAIVVLGAFFLSRVMAFSAAPATQRARQVFRASLLFLPALLLVFLLDTKLRDSGKDVWKLGTSINPSAGPWIAGSDRSYILPIDARTRDLGD